VSFAQPIFLLLMPLALLVVWAQFRRRKKLAIKYPIVDDLVKVKKSSVVSFSQIMSYVPMVFRVLTVVFLVLVMARPQSGRGERKQQTEGLDIMLAVDTSGSMRALDFSLNNETTDRLEAVKHVIKDFVSDRPDDRIGLVVFGEEAFTHAPLTLDHQVLNTFIDQIKIGMAGDSTALGDALATAVNRVKDIEAKSKIVILLTDGRQTSGAIDVKLAAKAAASVGVKVYTIGVGKEGKVPYLVQDPWGRQRTVYQESDLDEPTLKEVAEITHAKFFRAYDTDSLQNIYKTIDTLEKTKLAVPEFHSYNDNFEWLLLIALFFLGAELLLGITRFRSLP